MKKVLKVVAIVTLILLIAGGCVYMVYLRPFMQKMKQTTTIHYDKDLTIVLGGGGNSGILVSDSLVIVIDTKMDKAADEFYKMVKEMAGSKPILVVNTHIHPDHTGGNKNYSGQTIIAGGNYTAEEWKKENGAESLPTKFLSATFVTIILPSRLKQISKSISLQSKMYSSFFKPLPINPSAQLI